MHSERSAYSFRIVCAGVYCVLSAADTHKRRLQRLRKVCTLE
jgi:hypothetical protein